MNCKCFSAKPRSKRSRILFTVARYCTWFLFQHVSIAKNGALVAVFSSLAPFTFFGLLLLPPHRSGPIYLAQWDRRCRLLQVVVALELGGCGYTLQLGGLAAQQLLPQLDQALWENAAAGKEVVIRLQRVQRLVQGLGQML